MNTTITPQQLELVLSRDTRIGKLTTHGPTKERLRLVLQNLEDATNDAYFSDLLMLSLEALFRRVGEQGGTSTTMSQAVQVFVRSFFENASPPHVYRIGVMCRSFDFVAEVQRALVHLVTQLEILREVRISLQDQDVSASLRNLRAEMATAEGTLRGLMAPPPDDPRTPPFMCFGTSVPLATVVHNWQRDMGGGWGGRQGVFVTECSGPCCGRIEGAPDTFLRHPSLHLAFCGSACGFLFELWRVALYAMEECGVMFARPLQWLKNLERKETDAAPTANVLSVGLADSWESAFLRRRFLNILILADDVSRLEVMPQLFQKEMDRSRFLDLLVTMPTLPQACLHPQPEMQNMMMVYVRERNRDAVSNEARLRLLWRAWRAEVAAGQLLREVDKAPACLAPKKKKKTKDRRISCMRAWREAVRVAVSERAAWTLRRDSRRTHACMRAWRARVSLARDMRLRQLRWWVRTWRGAATQQRQRAVLQRAWTRWVNTERTPVGRPYVPPPSYGVEGVKVVYLVSTVTSRVLGVARVPTTFASLTLHLFPPRVDGVWLRLHLLETSQFAGCVCVPPIVLADVSRRVQAIFDTFVGFSLCSLARSYDTNRALCWAPLGELVYA